MIVDGNITLPTRERAASALRVELVETALGSTEAHEAVGFVDAIIMFDILLHQVRPDWDEFLLRWSRQTDTLIVYNQNWLLTPRTVRFVDRGLEWYRRNVVVWEDENPATSLDRWFARHHERDRRGRLERDSYDFWQFGIRPLELINLLARHGFELVHMNRDPMPFGADYPWIVNDGMVFRRAAYPESSWRRRVRSALARMYRRREGRPPTKTLTTILIGGLVLGASYACVESHGPVRNSEAVTTGPPRQSAAPPAVAHWKVSYDAMLSQVRRSGRPDCVTLTQVVARSRAALDEARRGGRQLREFASLIAENTQYAEALLVSDGGCLP